MRVIMWFAIGFGASCALGVYLLPQSWLVPCAAVCFGVSVPALAMGRKWRKLRILAVLLLGVGSGALRYQHYQTIHIEPARMMDESVAEAEFVAQEYSYETAYGYTVDAETDIRGQSHKVRVYLEQDPCLEPGDVFSGTFRFRFAAPKDGEKTSYLQTNGIFLIAEQRSELTVAAGEEQWQYYPARFANGIKELMGKAFPEDVFPFVKALLLGDTSDISYEVDTALKISGIRHVVAVSGLHVSILYGFVAAVTGRRRFITALIGIPVLALFAAVAGFTPSVTRACVMTGLMILAELLQKEYDGPTALSFACLIMLAWEPVAVSSVNLQLSAGCVAGILLFQSPVRAWIDEKIHNVAKNEKSRLKSWFSGSVAVTLSAMSLTTPLSAFYFGTVSIIGILTNLLTLWILNWVFIGIIVVCLLALVSVQLASWGGWLLAWPIRYVLLAAKLLSQTPFSAVYTASGYVVIWLALTYLLLFVLLLRRGKGKMPTLLGILLSLLAAVGISWLEPMLAGCTVTVLDVGQGQSIIVQTEGKTFLVDCGGDYSETAADTAANKLLSQGISRLDGILLTHGDDDHAGGLEYLLTRIDADLIVLPATEGDFELPESAAPVLWVDRHTVLSFGETQITIYPPAFSASGNENSLCILFDTEKCDILITGDRSERGERRLLAQYAFPEVDLLISGHHGAKSSTGEALLQTVRPDTVIISVGRNNIYGHPAPELLERLETFGCTVWRTDIHGTVVYRR